MALVTKFSTYTYTYIWLAPHFDTAKVTTGLTYVKFNNS